jgi:hypothetical protein
MAGPKDILPSMDELLAPFIVRGHNWPRDPVMARHLIEVARAANEGGGPGRQGQPRQARPQGVPNTKPPKSEGSG